VNTSSAVQQPGRLVVGLGVIPPFNSAATVVPVTRLKRAHCGVMQTALAARPLRSRLGLSTWLARWTTAWRSSVFLILDLPLGVIYGSVMITLLASSAGLLVIFFAAIPVLWCSVRISGVFATIERSRFLTLLEVTISDPIPIEARHDVSWFKHLWWDLMNPRTWRAFLYHLLMIPVAAVSYTVVVVGWTIPLLLLATPVLASVLPSHSVQTYLVRIHSGPEALFAGALGALLTLCVPSLFHAAITARVRMAETLLGSSRAAALDARIEVLQTSRTALIDAVDAERKRIERDLHDGAQQRLVSVALHLGMVKAKLGDSPSVPQDVRQLIDSAHTDAKRAIAELRDVARGVHPAILEDRGLGPALSSLAARCPVPVTVDIELVTRPSREVEAVAYYVVAEALTNIAKYANATQASIAVRQHANLVEVEVVDDGVGGATIGAASSLGGGLAGLRDRVGSVDGVFTVSSPLHGPTTIRAEMPCGS
jgi:signal transduction histidine kinase